MYVSSISPLPKTKPKLPFRYIVFSRIITQPIFRNLLFAMPMPSYLILFFLFEVHSILKYCHAKRKLSQVNIMVNVLNSGVGDHTTALFAYWKNFAYRVTKYLSFTELNNILQTMCKQVWHFCKCFWILNFKSHKMRIGNLVALCGKTCRIIW